MGKERIGDYDVDTSNPDHCLGSGTFGQVYLATHRKTGERVAAKKIPTYSSDERREYIQREIEALESIQGHPNVLQLLQVKTNPDAIWLITELCDQEDLAKYCKKHDVSLESMLKIMVQIATVINDLHEHTPKMVHRDLKPENILLMSGGAGGTLVAKLADFGLARAINRPGTLPLTTFGGTLFYMSPEFFASEVRYNESVDIFSMGLILITLIQHHGGELKCMQGKGV